MWRPVVESLILFLPGAMLILGIVFALLTGQLSAFLWVVLPTTLATLAACVWLDERAAHKHGEAKVGVSLFLRSASALLAGVLGGVIGGAVGLFIGAFVGGNFATDFYFAAQRGYESTGLLGAIVGYVLGGMACVFATAHALHRWSRS
jgi:hypothetical protein